MPRFLSKSRLMSSRQCLKRLHLEINRAELANVASATETAFRAGHEVGSVARQIYGGKDAVHFRYEDGLQHALSETRQLLRGAAKTPVFEATLQHQGVLARIDVLLPDGKGNGDAWRIVEVKASTSLKEEHLFDCAVQRWVFEGLGYKLSNIHLAHVDNSFVYAGDGDYDGLLTEVDVWDKTAALLPAVPRMVASARQAMEDVVPEIAVGSQCNQPYECPFMDYCWPSEPAYPVQTLPRAAKSKLAAWIAEGFVDLRDVPAERLSDRQLRVQRVTREGCAELLPAAGEFLRGLEYPRYYLDFETVSPAVPLWPGTRPYEVVPFQWSCHYEAEQGQIEHAEFLDLGGDMPVRRFAESLLRGAGTSGPVLVYTGYEQRVLKHLIDRYPDLAGPIEALVQRLVDLAPLTEQNFYAPSMAGSWSLKAVLPALSDELKYTELKGIQNGTEASEGYLEAVQQATTRARREQLRDQLLRYCQFDTLALVRLTAFLSQQDAS